MRRLIAVVGVVLMCSAATVEHTDVCLRVLLRALSFDRNLAVRAGADVTLLIAYDSRNSESVRTLELNRLDRARLTGYRLGGVDLRIVDVDLRHMASWSTVVDEEEPDAVLLLPGTQTWEAGILHDAPSRNYVVLGHSHSIDGMAISVLIGEEGRPVIVVDREAARLMGMDLSSQLLRLAVLR